MHDISLQESYRGDFSEILSGFDHLHCEIGHRESESAARRAFSHENLEKHSSAAELGRVEP